ncbi:MAG: hypothetical protein O7E57_15450 [Gammaproteobacteria bacterium]|nr:hypothetical protein [Gammaproteobacteria bacterium]
MDIAKRQLLRDLEIDVWVLRPFLNAHRNETTHGQHATVAQPATGLDVGTEPTAHTVEQSQLPVREPVGSSETDTGIAVSCVSAPGVLLLFEATPPLQDRRRIGGRLVNDLLAAVSGDWQISVRETQFTWPLVGVANLPSQDGPRALGAFVEKQMQECGAGWVLATRKVIDLLADGLLGDKLISMPPIQDLVADSEQKKQLWRQIQTRLT